MKTIVSVIGIRPDIIRMSEIIKKLDKESWCNHILIHAGQHYDKNLSDVFFDDLRLRLPDYDLELGRKYKTHYEYSANVSVELIKLFDKENIKPDTIIFLGDSNTVLASISLKKEGYHITHIESLMRSNDMRMFEEINRKSCDMVSDLLFYYHDNYKKYFTQESLHCKKMFCIGNTIVEPYNDIISRIYDFSCEKDENFVIVDIHRPENFQNKERMIKIFQILDKLSQNYKIRFLEFKRTLENIKSHKINIDKTWIQPLLGYKDYINLSSRCSFLISDSGSAQEECALLKKVCFVPRDFTERPESYDNMCSVNLNLNRSVEDLVYLISKNTKYMGNDLWLYHYTKTPTSQLIVNHLKEVLNGDS